MTDMRTFINLTITKQPENLESGVYGTEEGQPTSMTISTSDKDEVLKLLSLAGITSTPVATDVDGCDSVETTDVIEPECEEPVADFSPVDANAEPLVVSVPGEEVTAVMPLNDDETQDVENEEEVEESEEAPEESAENDGSEEEAERDEDKEDEAMSESILNYLSRLSNIRTTKLEETRLLEVSSKNEKVLNYLHKIGAKMIDVANLHGSNADKFRHMQNTEEGMKMLNNLSRIGEMLVSLGEPFSTPIARFDKEDLAFIAARIGKPMDQFLKTIGLSEGLEMIPYQEENDLAPMSKRNIEPVQALTNNTGDNPMRTEEKRGYKSIAECLADIENVKKNFKLIESSEAAYLAQSIDELANVSLSLYDKVLEILFSDNNVSNYVSKDEIEHALKHMDDYTYRQMIEFLKKVPMHDVNEATDLDATDMNDKERNSHITVGSKVRLIGSSLSGGHAGPAKTHLINKIYTVTEVNPENYSLTVQDEEGRKISYLRFNQVQPLIDDEEMLDESEPEFHHIGDMDQDQQEEWDWVNDAYLRLKDAKENTPDDVQKIEKLEKDFEHREESYYKNYNEWSADGKIRNSFYDPNELPSVNSQENWHGVAANKKYSEGDKIKLKFNPRRWPGKAEEYSNAIWTITRMDGYGTGGSARMDGSSVSMPFSIYDIVDDVDVKNAKKTEAVDESAPPSPEIERWIKDNKANFEKEYGKEKGEEILYKTAWKKYNESIDDLEVKMLREYEEEPTGTDSYYVTIPGNWYAGKYHEYGARRLAVPGSTPEEAMNWVSTHAEEIYAYYENQRHPSGKRLVMKPASKNIFLQDSKAIGPSPIRSKFLPKIG